MRPRRRKCSSWSSRWPRRSTSGRRLIDESVAGQQPPFARIACRPSPRTVPPAPAVNPLEEMVRDMLKPILKQWLDEHLPKSSTSM